MSTDFQEFLRQKTAGSDIRERNHNRQQWLNALIRLREQISGWLRQADPDGLMEVVPYEIRRVESRLGIYDAPALKIHLNADEIDLFPVGRYSIGPLPAETIKAMISVTGTDGPAAGRVDLTNGENKYILLRDIKLEEEHWFAASAKGEVQLFDRACLEAILQDLWS